jgi:putative hydrolase of the HAD superfamily
MDRPVEALLFDLGGVIAHIDFSRATSRWARHAGCDAALIASRYSHDEAYEKHERGEIDAAGYFATLRHSLGIDLSDAQFLDGWNAIFGGPIPGAAEWIGQACARLPIYAFSNTNHAHAAFWTPLYAEMLKPFRRVFLSSEIGLRKPDREAFAFVAGEIGVPMPHILFFDDMLANVEGARVAGLQAVHVRSNADVIAALEAIPKTS